MRLTLSTARLCGAVAVATLALTGTASADEPKTDDPRAVAFDKNVSTGHGDACTVGGLTGTLIAEGTFTFTGGKDAQDLDITAVAPGTTVTGVVVKGGDAFNVYLAAKLGATLPWNDLRAPFNNGGNIPAISHWYACGVVTEQPPGEEEPPKEEPPGEEQPPNEEEPPNEEQPPTATVTAPPSSSSEAPPTTVTTSTQAPAPAGADDLASTGFGSIWLVGLGAGLLAAGAAVLLVLRRRKTA